MLLNGQTLRSIKRIVQLAVFGIALAGLTACGGGGGGGPAPDPCPQGQVRGDDGQCRTPAPPECPQGQVRGDDGQCRTPPPLECPQGQVRGDDGQCMAEIPITPLTEYGSIAFSMNPWGAGWMVTRTSQTAARNEAVAGCERVCTGSSCGCQEVLRFRNACGSLARSADNSRAGVGWGTTENDAGQSAIAACRAAGGQDCDVVTSTAGSNVGRPSTVCAKAGSATPSGQASTIPPRPTSTPRQDPDPESPTPLNEYGSYAYSTNPWGTADGGFGTSPTAARADALAGCEEACSSSSSCGCQEFLRFRNACGALARSNDRNRAAFGWGETEVAAQQRAIARCHAEGGEDCTASTSSSGRPSSFCVKAGSATPSGQASMIPPRPSQDPDLEPPTLTEWGAVYIWISSVGGQGGGGVVTGHRSESSALNAVRTECSDAGGECRDGAFNTGCAAIANSACAEGETVDCIRPIIQFAFGPTGQQAENAAIQACQGAVARSSNPELLGVCTVSTSDRLRVVTGCVGTAR